MYCRKKTAPPKNAPLSLHHRDQGVGGALDFWDFWDQMDSGIFQTDGETETDIH